MPNKPQDPHDPATHQMLCFYAELIRRSELPHGADEHYCHADCTQVDGATNAGEFLVGARPPWWPQEVPLS